MGLGEYTQAHILGDEAVGDGEAVIESNGSQMRPIASLLRLLVDELKLHITPDGVWTRHVDPANVGLNSFHVYPEAFEDYRLDGGEFMVGLRTDKLWKAVKPARIPHKDPVEIRLREPRTVVSIAREYPMGTVEWADKLRNIDADAVRKEPDDIAGSLDELHEWRATVEVDAFRDSVEHLNNIGDHLTLFERDGRMMAYATTGSARLDPDDRDDDEEDNESVVDFGEVAEPTEDGGEDGAASLFSLDYIRMMAGGLANANIHTVDVIWGNECPVEMEYEKRDPEDETLLIEGAMMTAPRIQDRN